MHYLSQCTVTAFPYLPERGSHLEGSPRGGLRVVVLGLVFLNLFPGLSELWFCSAYNSFHGSTTQTGINKKMRETNKHCEQTRERPNS